MFQSHRFSGAAVAVLLLLVGGCASSPRAVSPPMSPTPQAVVVSAGQGGALTVFLPSADANNPIALCSAGGEVCPECKAAAVQYFTTGMLDPRCSRTGATRSITTFVPPMTGHN